MLAIEIASRGNRADQLDRKIAAYLQTGAVEIPSNRSANMIANSSAWSYRPNI